MYGCLEKSPPASSSLWPENLTTVYVIGDCVKRNPLFLLFVFFLRRCRRFLLNSHSIVFYHRGVVFGLDNRERSEKRNYRILYSVQKWRIKL